MNDFKDKVILTVAPTGSSTSRKQTPYVPLTPAEIAEETYRSWQAGASVVHLHVREDDGSPCMNYDKFKEAIQRIRDK